MDFRHALRVFVKSPGFSAIAVITIALGIGVNTTLFSVVNGVLLNPLPYPRSGELIALYGDAPGFDRAPVSYPNFLDWRRLNRSFSSMATYRSEDYDLADGDHRERVSGYMVSSDFFQTLGVLPEVGRMFRSDDDVLGGAPVAVIGGGLWARRFAASSAVVGRSIDLNGTAYTIVGVVPSTFRFYGNSRDVYTPIGQWADPSFRDRRINVSTRVFGRLKPGVTFAQAKGDMDGVARSLAAEYPTADKDLRVTLLTMKDDIVGHVEPLLLVLLAAVAFLLAIACANVANLVLARTTTRAREFATRHALGASRMRILWQLLIESLLLTGTGAVLGVSFAAAATTALLRGMPAAVPRAREVTLDLRVLLFTTVLSLAIGAIFGMIPAAAVSRIDIIDVVKNGGRGASGRRHVLQRLLVAAEIGITLVLLAGAGLMARSVAALWRVDLGYRPDHAVTFNLFMPATSSTTAEETRARLRQFQEAVRSIPGVDAVSITLGSRPMIHDSALPFWIEGKPRPANDNEMPQAMFYLAEAGFGRAMGLSLQRGRFIEPHDDEHGRTVIVVDDVFASTFFPGEGAVGRRVHLTQFDVDAEIVGVVRHVRQWGPGTDPASAVEAQFYFPFMQLPPKLMPLVAKSVAVVVRTTGDPAAVMEPVRRVVAAIDSRQTIYNVQTMTAVVADALAPQRMTMTLLVAFAALALALASVGIYGVVSYLVGQRIREFGVRVALGAQRRDILQLVLTEGVVIALAGTVAGLIAAWALTRLIRAQLFGVAAHDLTTFGAVVVVLLGIALAACCVPAWRATRVDPVVALRCE